MELPFKFEEKEGNHCFLPTRTSYGNERGSAESQTFWILATTSVLWERGSMADSPRLESCSKRNSLLAREHLCFFKCQRAWSVWTWTSQALPQLWCSCPACLSSLSSANLLRTWAYVSVLCTILGCPYWYVARICQGGYDHSKWEWERWPKSRWWGGISLFLEYFTNYLWVYMVNLFCYIDTHIHTNKKEQWLSCKTLVFLFITPWTILSPLSLNLGRGVRKVVWFKC